MSTLFLGMAMMAIATSVLTITKTIKLNELQQLLTGVLCLCVAVVLGLLKI